MSLSPVETRTPVFVDQTKKYVHASGERDYITATEPNENPLFKRFIDEKAYAEALSGAVIQCVDMLVYNPKNDSFLLGTRQQEPHSGDWVIGGRMKAGETVADSASRNMKRELGIDINPGKLRTVNHYNLVWDSREQPPVAVVDDDFAPRKIIGQAKGCHMTSTLELYALDKAELETMAHNEEYSMLRWVKPEEVLDAPEGAFHPCLVDMFQDGLDAVTTPDIPQDAADERLRLYGSIATAQSALRRLEK